MLRDVHDGAVRGVHERQGAVHAAETAAVSPRRGWGSPRCPPGVPARHPSKRKQWKELSPEELEDGNGRRASPAWRLLASCLQQSLPEAQPQETQQRLQQGEVGGHCGLSAGPRALPEQRLSRQREGPGFCARCHAEHSGGTGSRPIKCSSHEKRGPPHQGQGEWAAGRTPAAPRRDHSSHTANASAGAAAACLAWARAQPRHCRPRRGDPFTRGRSGSGATTETRVRHGPRGGVSAPARARLRERTAHTYLLSPASTTNCPWGLQKMVLACCLSNISERKEKIFQSLHKGSRAGGGPLCPWVSPPDGLSASALHAPAEAARKPATSEHPWSQATPQTLAGGM